MEQIKRFFENMDEIVYIADMDNYEIIYMNKRQRDMRKLPKCIFIKERKKLSL